MHPLLEEEDEQLIGLLNSLDKSISDGDSASQVYDYLYDFVALADRHFKNEEVIMKDYEYPEIISHKKEHADCKAPFGKDYMQFLRNWLEGHLSSADSRLNEFLYQVNANKNKYSSLGKN